MIACPRCKKPLRKHVSVYVDAPADCFSLNKKGIRSKDVRIQGVGWPTERMYCPKCGWLAAPPTNKKEETKTSEDATRVHGHSLEGGPRATGRYREGKGTT